MALRLPSGENAWGWLGVSWNFFFLDAEISSPSVGTDSDFLFIPIAPGARIGGEWQFFKPLHLGAQAQLASLFTELEGTLLAEAEAWVGCAIGKHGRLRGGYRVKSMSVDNHRSIFEDNAARLTMSGAFVSLELSF